MKALTLCCAICEKARRCIQRRRFIKSRFLHGCRIGLPEHLDIAHSAVSMLKCYCSSAFVPALFFTCAHAYPGLYRGFFQAWSFPLQSELC